MIYAYLKHSKFEKKQRNGKNLINDPLQKEPDGVSLKNECWGKSFKLKV